MARTALSRTPLSRISLVVLRVEDGAVAEVTVFGADLVPAFGLPLTL
ncbi:hypothetical protein [Actinomadura alba]|uniref:Uncharacterized protein n=1 Tax=Actinomadura alba TaxID=406431 RepID=A0ABR7LSV1_9ACTN|nr:hypothetical protein [Actinomadura alba]MBC6467835.1 hypothetical protein [Actinomadura alba]